MIDVKKYMKKFFKNRKKSDISRILELYFKAEDCELVGDDIVNLKNDTILGKFDQAAYTGKDLIIQARLISGKKDGEVTYKDHTIVVTKDAIDVL